ncbi:TPA: transposase [Legionella pneumophila]|nr:transposase [Legionella pneumophila]HAT8861209.1 transposase [Legionella pneumophila subsp. pneumophila]HAT1677264.1 transposase [Legionella pneumophila]HAT1799025.1 transposase [Legionella pneumophila]HAT1876509.1 transposase [Legionella pneumophila]
MTNVVLRTDISWRDVPVCYGKWHTIYTRFKRWSENGLFLFLVYQL